MDSSSDQSAAVGNRSPGSSPSATNAVAAGNSYAILSQPRTGSSLLMDLLRGRGLGTPDEYLHEDRIRVWWPKLAGADSAFDLQRYMALLRQSQSGPGGHFGIKVHYNHLRDRLKERDAIQTFMAGFDRIIVVTRVNKLAQAVSVMKAEQTGQWEAAAPRAKIEPSFNPAAIAEALRRYFYQQDRITELNLAASRPVLFVTYEDLRDSLGATWERAQNFLGVTPEPLPATLRYRPQRDARSRDFEERFMKLIQGEPVAD